MNQVHEQRFLRQGLFVNTCYLLDHEIEGSTISFCDDSPTQGFISGNVVLQRWGLNAQFSGDSVHPQSWLSFSLEQSDRGFDYVK